ncbi:MULTISPECIES: prephenate dehydratase [unclassified Novosphingobium]|uniref:prephenate dehydratase n=1 Tax=unclassified Novosphingobium TaxID=2644732 RepID=UPI0014428AA8|nr:MULTISPECIES: prephenate dehydratase [unclassified Novosphingobium]MBB3358943.1 prephenate dehydratase [Novosphingobium sp. BK256]MBB3375576.1 prephenate dehydratase [Novosphingobium sp. BK280]MBB3379715.1 prephenate dehydratase [Novosphingobium sp. BK258]MBB3421410.1 prephenate dehydratase [Novosphingobium sp. BK267]MBB3449725.1 prephenate dehydratase [Novosphingobium sp. BK352]
MQSFPEPARLLVDRMSAAAAADPGRAVAFQGAPGANSHRAAMEVMPDGLPLPCFSFEDALDAVKDGRAGQAIIPIENSQHGRVADIHFLLPESGLSIVAEHFLDIHHCLMARPGAGQIGAAYSHPQALGQSRFYLRERGIVPMAYADTAGAAALVAESGEAGIAAIAPRIAAELYGLDLLAEDIEDAHDNTTRFVLLSKTPRDPATLNGDSRAGQALTTFVFEVRNIPAALYKALGGFATNGVNMTKLESYQKGASFAATMFYADIVGAPGDPAVDRALEELAYFAKDLRILGSYPLERERG